LYFLKDILESFDFMVGIKEDLLTARLENLGQIKMCEKLRILGYLVIHTRQLDMIMSNSRAVNNYKNLITQDIEKIITEDSLSSNGN